MDIYFTIWKFQEKSIKLWYITSLTGVSTEIWVYLKFGKLERLCVVGNTYSCMRYTAYGWLHTVIVGLRCKST